MYFDNKREPTLCGIVVHNPIGKIIFHTVYLRKSNATCRLVRDYEHIVLGSVLRKAILFQQVNCKLDADGIVCCKYSGES